MSNLNWTTFKALIDAKGLSIQYIDDGAFYLLMANEGAMMVTCKLSKTLEADATDVTDFTTNYLSRTNRPNNTTTTVSTPIHTAVGTSAVRIDNTVLANRTELVITVKKDVFIGFANTITTSAGYFMPLYKGQTIALAFGPDILLWAISATASLGSDDVVVTQGAKTR